MDWYPKVLVVFGLALLLGGVAWGTAQYRFQKRCQGTQGVVVDYNRETANHKRPGPAHHYYYPVIEFTAHRGENIRFRAQTGKMDGEEFARGTKVDVVYDPERPSHARMNNFDDLWLGSATMAGIGSVLLVIGLVKLLSGE